MVSSERGWPTCSMPRYTAAMPLQTDIYQPGRRVRVIQQMPLRLGAWTTATEGVITGYAQATTGSWYAHSRDDLLWLDRLELRLDDGEIVRLNLDQYSVIELVDEAETIAPASDA